VPLGSAQSSVSPACKSASLKPSAPVPVAVEVRSKPVEVEVVHKPASPSQFQPQSRVGTTSAHPATAVQTAPIAARLASVSIQARVIAGTGLASMNPVVALPTAGSATREVALPTATLEFDDRRSDQKVQLVQAAQASKHSQNDGATTSCTKEAFAPDAARVVKLPMEACSLLSQLPPEAVIPQSPKNSSAPSEPVSPASTVPLVVVAEDGVFSGFAAASDRAGSSAGESACERPGEVRIGDRPTPIVTMPVLNKPCVQPFSKEVRGANILISDDGLTASRRCGCRECAVIGSGPLQRQQRGLFFEVVIHQVLDGWMGGVGLGVTHSSPGQLARLPDKAWRLPESFIVGYSGSAYLNGKEQRISWQPDSLQIGQRVGFLITGDGREHVLIFVDDKEVVRIDGADLHANGLRDAPLYPVVDVFNAAQVVTLNPLALAPSMFGASV